MITLEGVAGGRQQNLVENKRGSQEANRSYGLVGENIKEKRVIRIMLQNINGFVITANKKENSDIIEWMNRSDSDVLGATETNLC